MNFVKNTKPKIKFGKKIPVTELYYDDIKLSMNAKGGFQKELQLFNGKDCVATFGLWTTSGHPKPVYVLKMDEKSIIREPDGGFCSNKGGEIIQSEEVKKFFDLLIKKYEQKEDKKQKFTFGEKIVDNKKPSFTFGGKPRE